MENSDKVTITQMNFIILHIFVTQKIIFKNSIPRNTKLIHGNSFVCSCHPQLKDEFDSLASIKKPVSFRFSKNVRMILIYGKTCL